MIDLFKLGLSLYLDFITLEEETHLLGRLVNTPAKNTVTRNSVARYGSTVPYNSNMKADYVPEQFDFILDRVMERNLLVTRPDSVAVNEYLSGQGITPHIDSPGSGDVISILSLKSEARMVFAFQKLKFPLILPARSLVQMKDEVRTKWSHAIDPVTADRFSIVLRCSKNLKKSKLSLQHATSKPENHPEASSEAQPDDHTS